MNGETRSEIAEGRKGEVAPGHNLTTKQRELAEAMVREGLSATAAARFCGIPERTGQSWVARPEVRAYIEHLVSEAVAQARSVIRAKFAAVAPSVADTVAALAEGKGEEGKPAHPYQDKFCQQVLDRILGRPGQDRKVEAGVSVPTPDGKVEIIFRSGGAPRD